RRSGARWRRCRAGDGGVLKSGSRSGQDGRRSARGWGQVFQCVVAGSSELDRIKEQEFESSIRKGITMTDTPRPTETQAWKALEADYKETKRLHLRQLFADDPARGETFCAEGASLF